MSQYYDLTAVQQCMMAYITKNTCDRISDQTLSIKYRQSLMLLKKKPSRDINPMGITSGIYFYTLEKDSEIHKSMLDTNCI